MSEQNEIDEIKRLIDKIEYLLDPSKEPPVEKISWTHYTSSKYKEMPGVFIEGCPIGFISYGEDNRRTLVLRDPINYIISDTPLDLEEDEAINLIRRLNDKVKDKLTGLQKNKAVNSSLKEKEFMELRQTIISEVEKEIGITMHRIAF